MAIVRTPAGDKPVSLKTRNREEAERNAAAAGLYVADQQELIRRMGREVGVMVATGGKKTVAAAVDEYLANMEMIGRRATTARTTSYALGQWINDMDLADTALIDVTPKHVDRWINSAEKKKRKKSTRVRELSVLNTFFTYCIGQTWIGANPAHNIGVSIEGVTQKNLLADETNPFTMPEIQKLMDGLPRDSFWWFGVHIAWHTGIRLGDFANLQWENIRGDRLVLMTSKGQTLLDAPISPELKAIFCRIPKTDPIYCFPIEARIHRASSSALSQKFRRLCIGLGIEGKSFHSFRHAFALRTKHEEKAKLLNQLLEELALAKTQGAMAHASSASTAHYLKH